MVWHLIKPLIGELSKPFRDASLELLKVEKGVEAGAPPWKSCVTKTNSVMGFATGYLYIKERAGKNAKQQVRTSEKFLNTVSREFLSYRERCSMPFHVKNVYVLGIKSRVNWLQCADDRVSACLTILVHFVLLPGRRDDSWDQGCI